MGLRKRESELEINEDDTMGDLTVYASEATYDAEKYRINNGGVGTKKILEHVNKYISDTSISAEPHSSR